MLKVDVDVYKSSVNFPSFLEASFLTSSLLVTHTVCPKLPPSTPTKKLKKKMQNLLDSSNILGGQKMKNSFLLVIVIVLLYIKMTGS